MDISFRFLSTLLVLLSASGCAITSASRTALQFPHAGNVRTACLVAFTTNPNPVTSEQGAVGGINDAALVQGVARNRYFMERIATYAHDAHLKAFANWDQWTVVDARSAITPSILDREAGKRRQFADKHQKTLGFNTFVSHPELIPFKYHPSAELRTQELAELGNYARLCGTDAAIAIHADVSYETSTGLGFGGFNVGGTAKAVVDHAILIADQDGREIGRTSKTIESDDTVAMVSGAVVLNEKFASIVRSTHDKAAQGFIDQFSRELQNPPQAQPE